MIYFWRHIWLENSEQSNDDISRCKRENNLSFEDNYVKN